jgi:probable rRNA maturation factor
VIVTTEPARLRLDLQVVAKRPWVPPHGALRRWAGAAHRAALVRSLGSMRAAIAAPPAVLCIRVVGEDGSRSLNAEYRGKDAPTNVLSFPASAEERAHDGSLGDLVICAPVVFAEARAQHKDPDSHWAHMVVHGVLHLHGYDHETPAEARLMEGLEVEILDGFGYLNPYAEAAPGKP